MCSLRSSRCEHILQLLVSFVAKATHCFWLPDRELLSRLLASCLLRCFGIWHSRSWLASIKACMLGTGSLRTRIASPSMSRAGGMAAITPPMTSFSTSIYRQPRLIRERRPDHAAAGPAGGRRWRARAALAFCAACLLLRRFERVVDRPQADRQRASSPAAAVPPARPRRGRRRRRAGRRSPPPHPSPPSPSPCARWRRRV